MKIKLFPFANLAIKILITCHIVFLESYDLRFNLTKLFFLINSDSKPLKWEGICKKNALEKKDSLK